MVDRADDRPAAVGGVPPVERDLDIGVGGGWRKESQIPGEFLRN